MSIKNKKIRCAIYDRVSTDIQVAEGLSLEAQEAALINYAKAHNYEIVGIYTDEGITARKKMQNRKELLRLLSDVQQDKIDLILVTKLDRWFRNIKDYHNTQAILEAHNCNWKTIYEDYDTSTANGRFAINIMLSVNENECDRDSDRIKEVFKYKVANGEWLGGRPPFGYMRNSEQRLIKNPETSAYVEDMFRHYFVCMSKSQTVKYMLAKYGDAVPAGSNLAKMFTKEIYAGMRNGVQICEPYITLQEFRLIQQTSDSRKYAATNEPFLFSGILLCPHCKNKLTASVSVKKKPYGTYHYKTYQCHSKWIENHPRPCKNENVIETYLFDNISRELEAQLEFHSKNKVIPLIDADKLKKELQRLNLMYQKGRIEDDYYDSEYKRITELINSYSEMDNELLPELIKNFSGDWKELYNVLDYDHKKAFWKRHLNTIYIDPNTHELCGIKFNGL